MLPSIVSEEEWRAARDELLEREKALTRARDEVAALRRRLPMVHVRQDHVFDGPDGPVRLIDLFEGRRQLIVHHFVLPAGSARGWEGCAMLVDNMGHPAHLNARDTTRVLVSPSPLSEITPFRERMGWTEPWYSSHGTTFTDEMDDDRGSGAGLSVFLRTGGQVYRTYHTTRRGVEELGTHWSYLDLTPMGRQELWEDSPAGHPQSAPYEWWRLHDEY